MIQRLVDKPPELSDYVREYVNSQVIKEQIFNIGTEGFINKGRGVVVVDLRRFAERLARFYYLSSAKGGQWDDREMEEVVHSYDPDREVIVFLFFGEYSAENDCYKVAVQAS